MELFQWLFFELVHTLVSLVCGYGTCLWIKSIFRLPDDWCIIDYIHETMVVQLIWVWTFSTIIVIIRARACWAVHLIYIYIYMNILNGVGFYGHSISYRSLPLHCFRIPVPNNNGPNGHLFYVPRCSFLSFTILTMSFTKCAVLYHTSVLCIDHCTCFVKNDEIKISNLI